MTMFSSVTTSMADMVEAAWTAIGAEAVMLTCFVLGFVIFNSKTFQNLTNNKSGSASPVLEKQIAAHYSSGNFADAVQISKNMKIESADILEMLVSSLVELKRFGEIMALIKGASVSVATSAAPAVLSALSSNVELLKDASAWFSSQGVANDETTEIIATAYVQVGDLLAVKTFLDSCVSVPAKVYAKVIKEALRMEELKESFCLLRSMQSAGFYLPNHLTTQLIHLGAKLGRVEDVMAFFESINVSTETLTSMFEYFCKEGDLAMVEKMIAFGGSKKVALQHGAYDAVLKAFAKKNDSRAFEYFDKLVGTGAALQDQTIVHVLTHCVEGRNVPLAEHVFTVARAAGCASLAVYSALVRVYAATRLFHKTCDLCTMLQEDGLEPDTVMYGGLIKAAVECGRLDLSRSLLCKSGTLDIQNYMSLFRACGRERNVKKALELLKELEESSVGIDTTAYNCVLDVCIKCGDRRAAADLFTKMKVRGFVDVISYNTLLKGMGGGATGLTDSHMILKEMRDLNLAPNQITFNSLINYAIRERDVKGAWEFIGEMERDGVAIDNFTCSIMCKGLKFASGKDDLDKTLCLIERSGVTPDDVLVNTLLDACIRLRDVKRLTSALKTFRYSGATPSEHAYGTVLRAYGHARAVEEAQATWKDMLERKVMPSEATISSMIDTCVMNGAIDAAWAVIKDLATAGVNMQSPVTFYTTIIKAFAQRKQMARAMEVYEDMKASNVRMALVTFNTLIDLCARGGDVELAAGLFRDMCVMGVTPDIITYTTIIKGYCVQGDLEQGIQLFTMMRKKNIQPDAMLFNAIIDGCARKQMTSMVEMMLSDMESSGISPTNQTLNILVKLHGKNSDLDTAFAYVDAMPKKHGFEANAQVYTSLMQACVSAGHLAKGQEVFQRLRSPDAKAYSTLINGYLKHSDVQGAVRVLEGAIEKRVTIEQELVDNVLFMANRRKISSVRLSARLQSAGYGSGRSEQTEQRVPARRQQGQAWRTEA